VLPAFVNDPFAWLRDVQPLLIRSSSQFGGPPPFPLTSRRYAREFDEVKSLGAVASSTRTQDQTDAARFWGASNREADSDRNARTLADPAWLPLINTPPYPDWPSGLSALSGASARTLQHFFGTDRFTFGTTNAIGTRSYTSFSQAEQEVVGARVWSGIHFRRTDEVGAAIGERVASWQQRRFLQPDCGHRGDARDD
jgi:hypothetical protein